MRIRNKAILIFIVFTTLIITPFSAFIMNLIEKSVLQNVITQNVMNTRVFSKSVSNTLMMNGGNIATSRVDTKDLLLMLEPLRENGLVYADAVLISSDPGINGTILASIVHDDKLIRYKETPGRIPEHEIIRLLNQKEHFREFIIDETYIEFFSFGRLPGKPPFCVTRIIVKKSAAMKSASEIKKYMSSLNLITFFIVLILAAIFGGYSTKPIKVFTMGVKEIEAGNYSHRVQIKSHDEIGELAMTFNNMAAMINSKMAELKTANIELKKMDTLKDEFLANTSHELKTPIHGIMGLSESLLDGVCGEPNSNMRHILEMISKSSKRLSHLVSDILDYSRLKNSDIKLNKTAIDMKSMTDAVITILSAITSKKDLKIINDIKPGTSIVFADENRLHQIMINLIGNAIKFTEEGEIRVSSKKVDNAHIIEISDTGIGIPEHKHEIIFRSFVQSDGSISRNYGGTGLGLAITKDFVELHGGRIWVKSEPGKGSQFSFTLPATSELPVQTEEKAIITENLSLYDEVKIPENKNSEDLTGAKILVIDDDPINLQILINHLTVEKYNVVSASGGKIGLEYINGDQKFDLVLLDVMMPEISGYEVCSRIREQYNSYELPVIMLTAKNRPNDVLAGLSMGANDYITKPFDKNQILMRIKNYVSLKKAIEKENKFIALKQELEIARTIQRETLPQSIPDMKKIRITSRYEPMMEIGGDFYDFCEIDENRIGILIADVTGHGVPAALISSMIKIAFRTSNEYLAEPAALLEKLSKALFAHMSGRFITAFYLFIDTEKMEVSYSNAGHWPMYLINQDSTEIKELTVKGRLVGIDKNPIFNNASAKINSGDRIILFTDGLID